MLVFSWNGSYTPIVSNNCLSNNSIDVSLNHSYAGTFGHLKPITFHVVFCRIHNNVHTKPLSEGSLSYVLVNMVYFEYCCPFDYGLLLISTGLTKHNALRSPQRATVLCEEMSRVTVESVWFITKPFPTYSNYAADKFKNILAKSRKISINESINVV